MNFKDKLKELKPQDLNCNVFDVYNYNGLSIQDLLCQFYTKINDCVDMSNNTLDIAAWLVNEGLKQEVAEKLVLWYEDGSLEELINTTLFENLNKKINDVDLQLNLVTKDEFNLSLLYCNDINCNGGCGKIKGDDIHDDTSGFKQVFQNITQSKIKIPKGTYKITSKLDITKQVEVEGNNFAYNGAILKFYGTSGFDVKVDFVSLKNLTLIGNYKLSTDLLNIDNRNLGFTGINFVYSDNNTSSGCVLEDVTINNFNTGISCYNVDSQVWSGAYREFRNIKIVNCDLGYFSSKTTHDKFIGGHINYSWLHPVYVTSNNIESNIDFIGTTFDGNRDKQTSIYCEGENTSIRIENSYLEYLNINNTKGGKILLNNSFVNPNVKMAGQGIININNVWGSYSNKYYFNFLKDNTWGNDVEIKNKTSNSCKIFSNVSYSYKSLTGFIPIKSDLKINDLKSIKLSFDYNINSGSNINDFGLKTGFLYVEKGTSTVNYINTSAIIDNEVNKYDFTNKKGHYEVIFNLDKVTVSRDVLLSELRYVLKFNNTINGEGKMDFSSENLDVDISNLCLSLYSNNELYCLDERVYKSDLNKIENKIFNKFSGFIEADSSVTITLPNNNYEPSLCLLSVVKSGGTNVGVDIVGLLYPTEWLGVWTEITRKVRSTTFNATVSINKSELTITNNNNSKCSYTLKNCLIN